jgi:Putative endonuclease segE, GIY-YIG domain
MDLGHWITKLTIDTNSLPYGFIYVITNTKNGKVYIGKKQMKSVKKLKPLKGKKNKRHFDIETDWKTYTSSSNELNEDIIKYGKENFTFEIVKLCDSKFELAYYEAKMQFDANVLLENNYYNGIINCRIGRAPDALLKKLALEKKESNIEGLNETSSDSTKSNSDRL